MKKKLTLLTFSIYLITITIICSIIFIYFFYKQLGHNLIKCAEDEINHLMSLVMNNCINKYIKNTNELNLLIIERDNNNNIERIKYNTKILNSTRNEIIDTLEVDLDYMTDGKIEEIGLNLNKLSDEHYEKTNKGILFTVSIGSATGNPFFSNLGPKIPINLISIGDATAEIITDIKEYGMNNALINISIKLQATTIIQMPFLSKEVTISNTIPLTMELLQGTIPNYYLTNTPNIND